MWPIEGPLNASKANPRQDLYPSSLCEGRIQALPFNRMTQDGASNIISESSVSGNHNGIHAALVVFLASFDSSIHSESEFIYPSMFTSVSVSASSQQLSRRVSPLRMDDDRIARLIRTMPAS